MALSATMVECVAVLAKEGGLCLKSMLKEHWCNKIIAYEYMFSCNNDSLMNLALNLTLMDLGRHVKPLNNFSKRCCGDECAWATP